MLCYLKTGSSGLATDLEQLVYMLLTYAERLEIINGNLVPSKMEERILKRTCMAVARVR